MKTQQAARHTFLNEQAGHPRPNLPQSIWGEHGHMQPEVRQQLLKIAQEFHRYLNVPTLPIDITLTGSMANFNWTPQSDLDVHPLYDYARIDDNIKLVKELMLAKKAVWNDAHDIKVRKHDVELYAQDIHEAHHASGVYSLVRDTWIKIPIPREAPVDHDQIMRKAQACMHMIDTALRHPNRRTRLEKIKDKLKQMRTCGLASGGEYSVENLAFKVLRNRGYLTKLSDMITRDQDAELSMETTPEA